MDSSALTAFGSSENRDLFVRLIKENQQALVRSFDASTPVISLIKARAIFIDKLLTVCWRAFLGPSADTLALIAVGGYGRQELHPYSDIDLLVLLDEHSLENDQAPLEAMCRFCWDIGLKLGQSVRTVAECIELASQDQTIFTTLMESRLIDGSAALYQSMNDRIGQDRLWPADAFFAAKMAEQQQRHSKFHHTANNLEPNIKESPGGLRDIQLIAWVIKRRYNSQTLYELVKYGSLTEAEYAELMAGQKFLWKVRFALHSLTGRCEDRLRFTYQKQIAERFGYHDREGELAIEQFMQYYYRIVIGLERLNEMLMQLFQETMLKQPGDQLVEPINQHFQSVNNFIEVTSDTVFAQHPLGLLEIFLLQQQIPALKGIRASTIRLIRQNLHRIDDRFRYNRKANELFMAIFKQRVGLTHQLKMMNRYGVLAAYLPAFAHIVGRMQYDLIHIYTVDEHTLFLVRNLRRFALDKHNQELPFCSSIFQLISRPELLYLAGLLHDIAKGKGGDHSVLGEAVSERFCQQHGLNDHDTKLIKWLVRNHLIMSMTAQRKDITDPEVIHPFARQIGNLERLNYLYLLTVADIRATNPELWNNWKDQLLRDLYIATHNALYRGLDNPIDQRERIETAQKDARRALKQYGLEERIIDSVWSTLPEEYFLRYSPDECAWHTIAIASVNDEALPLVLLRPQNHRGSAELFIYANSQDYIFSYSTATLDQIGLSILDARVLSTNDDHALYSYLILEQSGEAITDIDREKRICNKVREQLVNHAAEPQLVTRREALQAVHFPIRTQVLFHNEPQWHHTVLELIATDHPGLLSRVGQLFRTHQIRLHNAKVTTIGSRAEDMFYITEMSGEPLLDEQRQQTIKTALIELLEEKPDEMDSAATTAG